jgi:hypothetical protein
MNIEEQMPNKPGENTGSAMSVPPDAPTAAVHTALRRRLILGGMVGLPAALAVMKPVKTLAKAKKACSYSGWHSFKLNSRTSAHPKSNCKGGKKSNFWYSKAKKKLPVTNKKNGKTITSSYTINNYAGHSTPLYQTTTFNQLFGSGSTQTIIQCLQSGSSNQGAFLTALLNATYLGGWGYPYTQSDIYKIWHTPTTLGTGVTQTQAALFFQQLDSFG